MAPGLIAGGIDLHILPLGMRLDLAHSIRNAGAVIHQRDSRAGRAANFRAVLKVARRTSPDLVHTTLYEADVAGRAAAKALGIPSSTSIVNDSYGSSHYAESMTAKLHVARALDACTAQFANGFHAISEAIAGTVPHRLGIARSRVTVIPRGRDPHAYRYRDSELRRNTRGALGIPDDAKVILAIGRLEPQKGLHHLLNALPAVSRAHPDVLTLVAGKDGRSASSLRSKVEQDRMRVHFLGHRHDIPALLSAADVFCFPSEREGFGGVLMEAMAVGCPIVASSIPTTLEVLNGDEHALTGIATAPGDAEAIARALTRVLGNAQEAAAMAAAARSSFERRFDIKHINKAMIAFFENAYS
ncbi:glycogen(starch) synthase [Humibacillus xanthopallidus]|uniref:D-inositol 3-phosphate glycosyltransferase n=2 Tax=Humibacillus xanthopallidus TaxID=412689 RepID=A0A543PXL2_9MICO|nr:glycogen(starch) synthase [Humibacillus xanthopallidus]